MRSQRFRNVFVVGTVQTVVSQCFEGKKVRINQEVCGKVPWFEQALIAWCSVGRTSMGWPRPYYV